jgi:predicted transcriptional regulator
MPRNRGLTPKQQTEYEWAVESEALDSKCKHFHITYTEIAKRLEVKPQTISRQFVEKRVQKPTEIIIKKMISEREKNEI